MRRVALLLGPLPKIPRNEVLSVLRKHGFVHDEENADFGLAVGGDGLFSYLGRVKDLPLLFVGYHGSRANLAEVDYRDYEAAISRIANGSFSVEEFPLLSVSVDKRLIGVAFTDTYLERGLEPRCLRYEVRVETESESFTDFAVSNGVVVTTPAGSSGYYSYPDKLRGDEQVDVGAHTKIPSETMGICHILPTYTIRLGSDFHPLRYTIPLSSKVTISLKREANARLYGVGKALRGYPISKEQVVEIRVSNRKARIIRLKS